MRMWRFLPNEPEANKLFRMVMKYKGSDLHLKVGLPPVHAAGRRAAANAASRPDHLRHGTVDVSRCCRPASEESSTRKGASTSPTSSLTATSKPGSASTCSSSGGGSAWWRGASTPRSPTSRSSHLPPVLAEITSYDQGIIILAGVTGSGKSTTIASMLQYMNERERLHIVTIEDPIEYHVQGRQVDHQPARGRHRRDRLGHGAEACRAARPRHHPGGRDARPRHLQRGHARGRDRAPGLWHDPRRHRPLDDRPSPRPLPPRHALVAAAVAGVQPQGDHRPEAACPRPRNCAAKGTDPGADQRDHAVQSRRCES